jgi:hypothetical protein
VKPIAARVLKLKVIRPYVIELQFSNGICREVDLGGELDGGAFEALKDAEVFAQAFVEGVGIAWPNGASFSPEFLYYDARSPARA